MVKNRRESKPYRCSVDERLGVHRITVHRWLKQYIAGGLSELLEIRQGTGRYRVIPSAVVSGISEKLSEESCDFKTYKEIGQWVEENYQVSVKYQTLHKQVHYRMKANLKEQKPVSNEKAQDIGIEFKKSKKLLKNN
ncbi:helix-turn-helix domain-containing protein [Microcoleus sp. Pol14C6]|uniref:helix-turn-helix domain-containing protein n=1 Tax=unclassified Microcoleus TaxID=2642155 RepID=UPI002FD5F6AE